MSFTIYGTDDSEDIDGTSDNDFIYGFGGDDLLIGYEGNDHLYGGSGDDDLHGGTGINTLWGGGGVDWFILSPRAYGPSDDLIADFEFDYDQIDVSTLGISDFSQIKAILKADGYGDATFNAFAGGYAHRLTIDTVAPSELAASDFVYSDRAARNIVGTSFGDTIFGSRYADTLNGAGGRDILLGGFGSDRLLGSSGNDDLNGGAGRDPHDRRHGLRLLRVRRHHRLASGQHLSRSNHRFPGGHRHDQPEQNRRQCVRLGQSGLPLHRYACLHGGRAGEVRLLGLLHDRLGQHRRRRFGRIPGCALRPSQPDPRRLHPLIALPNQKAVRHAGRPFCIFGSMGCQPDVANKTRRKSPDSPRFRPRTGWEKFAAGSRAARRPADTPGCRIAPAHLVRQ